MKTRIPPHVPICGALIAGMQVLVYFGTRALPPLSAPHDWSLPPDRAIPLIPAWIAVYFLAYVTWVTGFWRNLNAGRTRAIRITFAYGAALLVCGLCFVLIPCTMTRPEVPGEGIFSALVRLLYRIDEPGNLLPSIHVLASYFCWRGLAGRREVPLAARLFYLAFLLLVCLSILFVRQHVLVDIPAAAAVGEGAFRLARVVKPERFFPETQKHLHPRR